MRLYDFSAYAKLREEKNSAQRVLDLLPHLNEPGAANELKKRVEGWMVLHREILKKSA